VLILRKNSIGKVAAAVIGVLFVSCVFADSVPPKVVKSDPAHRALNVYPHRYIHFWLVDPSTEEYPDTSGVDLNSIELWINGEFKPLTLQMQGKNRIWAYTSDMQILPENTLLQAIVFADDLAGNRMKPYSFQFYTTEIPDEHPPAIHNFIPADQSIDNVRHPLISCWIEDNGSGVDTESIVVLLDNQQMSFTYAELDNGFALFCIPPQPFEFDQWVHVAVFAHDYTGNFSEGHWDFKIRSAPPEAPNLFHPANGALMNYQLEDGKLRFIWQSKNPDHCYRLRIKPSDGDISDIVDLEPGDYWSASNLAGYNFQLSYNRWFQFSCKDYLEWSVAIIDKKNGVTLSQFSQWSWLKLAPPNAVVLRSPEQNTAYGFLSQAPLFTWDRFKNAQSYMFGIAKLDFPSGLFQNLYTATLFSDSTSHRMAQNDWRSLGSGFFIWAVIATDQYGNYSDFMNLNFTISAPMVITEPLNIH
jgi:hypothetical protein